MSLKEIARRTGASVSTVSRVLNRPDYHCLDPQLETRIWNTAKELNYLPNAAARQLKMGTASTSVQHQAKTIDIFLTRFQDLEQDLFFKELYDALREELLRCSCFLGNLLTLPDITELSRDFSLLSNSKNDADGIIILGKCPTELIPFIKNYYHNILGIDRNPTDFDYDEIICNGTTAATTAMDYLISLGHKKIAYIGDCSYEARYIGYYQSLISHKLPLDYANIYPTFQTREEGMEIMEKLLTKADLPTAIFCANDSTALGVLDGLKKKKRKGYIPSIISIDNIKESEITSPMLTTIDIPKKEMAHHGVKILLDRMQGGHLENVRVEMPCRLMIRESCSYCV